MDSRAVNSASAEFVDCFATASAVSRNDRENANEKWILGFLKKPAAASPCTAIACFAVGLWLFYTIFGVELDLMVCGCPKNRVINRIAHPKPNPPKANAFCLEY